MNLLNLVRAMKLNNLETLSY